MPSAIKPSAISSFFSLGLKLLNKGIASDFKHSGQQKHRVLYMNRFILSQKSLQMGCLRLQLDV